MRRGRLLAHRIQALARVSSRSSSFDKRRLARSQARVRSTSQRFVWRQKVFFFRTPGVGFSTRKRDPQARPASRSMGAGAGPRGPQTNGPQCPPAPEPAGGAATSLQQVPAAAETGTSRPVARRVQPHEALAPLDEVARLEAERLARGRGRVLPPLRGEKDAGGRRFLGAFSRQAACRQAFSSSSTPPRCRTQTPGPTGESGRVARAPYRRC
jgi:hypothetical protein